MKIIHIGHAPLFEGHPDFGRLDRHPGSWVVNLCAAQAVRPGMDVELVTHVPGALADHRDDSLGFPLHYVASPDRFRAATLFYFDARRIARTVNPLEPDVVHAHGTEDAYVLAAQRIGCPYVVTAQGMFSQINAVMPPRPFSRPKIVEFVERRSLARARNIIAKSDYVADWIGSQYPRLTVHRIPNTFDARLLSIPLDPEREPRSIAFVGNIDPRKGLHLLADALEQSPISNLQSLTLHIFGNREKPSSDYEQSTIANLKTLLGDRLVLHGVVPATELPNLVSKCELLVAPSLEEMFGNQVIEALLVGAWPVVSSGTAMQENVEKIGAGSVFENGSPEKLLEALEDAFTRTTVWDRQNTRDTVDAMMGPRSVAERHGKLYRSLLP